VGIIGTGIMGADHARLLSGVISGACVVALSDLDLTRARLVADTSGSPRVLADPLALIAAEDVDAVLIASSDQTHEDYVLACVAVGKPVLCEKPLAPGVDGCERILEAETAHGSRLVSVGFMRRYDPGYTELKRILDDGDVGAPLMLHCVHRNPAAPAGTPSEALITNSAVHELDLSRWLLGEEIVEVTVHTPRSSTAAGATRDPQFLVLRSAAGVVIDIEVFVNARYGYDVRCELVGELGTVELDAQPATALRRTGSVHRTLPQDWRPRFAEAYRRELQDWVDGLRGGDPGSGATAWDGYAATVVAQACVRALASNRSEAVILPQRPKLYA
jgi:myo-inositol 2-dehydrogenase/D-chiro-inositol 1-dehydrogenase